MPYVESSPVPQIVIDTNVLVSGLRSSQGWSHRLLQRVGTGRFDINLSVPLVLEYEAVLLDMEPDLPVDEEVIQAVIDFHCRVARKHRIFYLWRPRLKDPDDGMVFELAVRANCDVIVTFNQSDFVGVEEFGIEVRTPGEFLKQIGAGPGV
ncbi:PIN domain-containing protein [Salisaeta longa]|uniref:PIN domain-containing protein n=1 Tax=Salisaeta longa TaxID=503170 RepID=UPI0003B5DCB4|nr:PIN domain-containing protein [Salisaeta longa]